MCAGKTFAGFSCTISINPPQRPIFACGKNGKAPKKKDTSYQMGKVQGSRQGPAKRSWWEGEEKVRPAYEKRPKAFFIALGLFLSWSGQRGSNSLPGIPQMAFGHSREPYRTSD